MSFYELQSQLNRRVMPRATSSFASFFLVAIGMLACIKGESLSNPPRTENLSLQAEGRAEKAAPVEKNEQEIQVRPNQIESGLELVPRMDLEQMKASIEILASDEFNGRYTTSPELIKAADWIESKYREWNIQGFGGQYRHPFSLRLNPKMMGTPKLRILDKGKNVTIAASSIRSRVEGQSGVAKGSVVFVGYAAQSQETEGKREYDDLEGIDLFGKVALLFEGTPNEISYRALYKELRQRAEKIVPKLEKALSLKKNRQLLRLHQKFRKDVANSLQGKIVVERLPQTYWAVPEQPGAKLDIQPLFDAIVAQIEARPGPKFRYRENRMSAKLARIVEKGAIGAIVVQSPKHLLPSQQSGSELPAPIEREVYREPVSIPVLQMSWREAKRRFVVSGKRLNDWQKKIDVELHPQSQDLAGRQVQIESTIKLGQIQVPNLAAYIPGSDLADEVVVIGAHYDHIGDSKTGDCRATKKGTEIDDICNGADDNATGTAAVLELARVMAKHRVRPRRTMVFLHFAGEELGLLGSKALVRNPPFDLNRVVAMINIDMIGRLEDRSLTVSGISTSQQWMPLFDSIGTNGINVLYDRAITSRSDHADFYRHKVPVIFFFTGVHEDYHRATDEFSKLDFPGMRSISGIIADLVHRLGQGVPVAWQEPKPGQGLEMHLPGENPATIEKHIVVEPSRNP